MTHREMDCPLSAPSKKEETVDILLDYSAGRLDKARTAQLARHLKTCGACAAFLTEQSALWSILDEWEPEPVTMDFNRRLWQRIDLIAAAPWYRRLADSLGLRIWKPAIPLAAAMFVVATAFVMDHRENAAVPLPAPRADGVSITEVNQVERTLDDIQLLKQLDSTVARAGASKRM